jgi:hypothetical protein
MHNIFFYYIYFYVEPLKLYCYTNVILLCVLSKDQYFSETFRPKWSFAKWPPGGVGGGLDPSCRLCDRTPAPAQEMFLDGSSPLGLKL